MRAGENYPRQREAQDDGLAGHPVVPSGRPGVPGGRRKRAWPTWWIAPYLGGALAVLVVFAGLRVTVLRPPAGHTSAASSSSSSSAAGLMPAQIFPDALFQQLTKDIQGDNEKAFLSLVAPSAQPAVRTWWDNLQAIGFTTGLIMPTNQTDQVNLNAKGDGTTVVLAGTHNALDPRDDQGNDAVPLERYQLTLHFSSPTAIGQITAWKPLGNAPWDSGKLFVRSAANVVVAGPAADSAEVEETVPIAQAAAAYDIGLINNVHSTDLHQLGFVVFVSSDPAVRSSWFNTTKQPSQWPPASATGLTAQLPGPGASADTNWKLGSLANDTTGGARVVITPFEDQSGGTPAEETAELVSRFAVDILAASDQSLGPGSAAPSVPTWAIQGFGTAFEATYYSSTNPAPSSYSFEVLDDALKKLPASYKTGAVPTDADLSSALNQATGNWSVVAGSVYAYIAVKAGMGQLLASAELMWTQFADPRGNVLESNTNGTLTFFGKDTIQSGWQAYLANPTGLAPPIGPSGV